jgi:hypothetical protein
MRWSRPSPARHPGSPASGEKDTQPHQQQIKQGHKENGEKGRRQHATDDASADGLAVDRTSPRTQRQRREDAAHFVVVIFVTLPALHCGLYGPQAEGTAPGKPTLELMTLFTQVSPSAGHSTLLPFDDHHNQLMLSVAHWVISSRYSWSVSPG